MHTEHTFHDPLQPFADQTLPQRLRRWASQHGAHTALVCGTVRMSYTQLDLRVDRLAGGLAQLGITAGDRVMLQLPNGVGFVCALFAVMRIGAVPVLAMPTQRAEDIAALCRLAEPVAYLIPERLRDFDFRDMAARIIEHQPSLTHVIVDGEPGPFKALSALDGPCPADPLADPRGMALLLLSGGTTGTPKLIPRSHADYTYNFSHSARLCELDNDSVYLAVLPAAHNFTLACPGLLGSLAAGATVVLGDSASCDAAMPLIEREGVTHVALVPPLAQLWAQGRDWEDSDLSSLKLLQVGGSRLDPALATHVLEALDCRVQQVFGMAEGLLCYTRPDDPLEIVLNTQGRPLSPFDEVRLVDTDMNEVASGQTGELLTRGPYTITGYYQAAEHNARSFTHDGYYRSGDLARWTPEGNLIVEGRIKEQIQRSGEKISAAHIENHLTALPDIDSAVVVAVPDPLLGERICAFILGNQPAGAAHYIRDQLRLQGLGEDKLPDQFEWLAAWPLTAVGKIDKRQLAVLAQ
ncbi:yersiniabactin biosynthesis salycil-AMP ligase YbtE [Pseudomonas sp. CDFA 602]|uniref:yersiniabactin biosynthesis salycil-AMP ligase YbtE n=1 Tax=Pseudomonas californiensis TaxID=2829823 RepID=UPI001E515A02|nr:yersiniabactin biosynthesis salycil-AMP ligase YbtE [Pseudomonas californiensis]MCD5992424.1 yersiniabactin biosynthesis salycil-AMP ligase YbtE [Pseudomonas californiensis]MCD5998298.1 yersiniabactin biosynthesis salycil-AMP ligase YbtE [Pseudomonas californiensis]